MLVKHGETQQSQIEITEPLLLTEEIQAHETTYSVWTGTGNKAFYCSLWYRQNNILYFMTISSIA